MGTNLLFGPTQGNIRNGGVQKGKNSSAPFRREREGISTYGLMPGSDPKTRENENLKGHETKKTSPEEMNLAVRIRGKR